MLDLFGKTSRAVGEGASDTVSFLLHNTDRIGVYVSPPIGMRRYRYQGYPLTYK